MSQAEHDEVAHPTPRQYVGVGIILTIITAIEVAIYYIDAMKDVLVPFLIAFSFIKFALVVLWFMHLKFDSPLFKRLFVSGLILALVVFFIALSTILFRGGPAPTAG